MLDQHEPRDVVHKLVGLVFRNLLGELLNFELGPEMGLFIFGFMIKFSPLIIVAVTLDKRLLGMVEHCGLDKSRRDVFLVG